MAIYYFNEKYEYDLNVDCNTVFKKKTTIVCISLHNILLLFSYIFSDPTLVSDTRVT